MVGQATGMKPQAARMRFTRLMRYIGANPVAINNVMNTVTNNPNNNNNNNDNQSNGEQPAMAYQTIRAQVHEDEESASEDVNDAEWISDTVSKVNAKRRGRKQTRQ